MRRETKQMIVNVLIGTLGAMLAGLAFYALVVLAAAVVDPPTCVTQVDFEFNPECQEVRP